MPSCTSGSPPGSSITVPTSSSWTRSPAGTWSRRFATAVELGLPVDAGLARQAGEHLAEAGRKAAVRMDVRAVDKLLTRSSSYSTTGTRFGRR